MISKTSVLFTIVGTVVVGAGYLPRKISDQSHGWGYAMHGKQDGSFEYEAYVEFAWDFDLNCARFYTQSYEGG